MASSSSSSCMACTFLRRSCAAGCVFAPYFPQDQPSKFAKLHNVFGASYIGKLLNELPVHQREDAVNSLVYQADARARDSVYGSVGAITERQVAQLQNEVKLEDCNLATYASAGSMIAVQGNASQGLPCASLPSLEMGMNLSSPHSREQQKLARDLHDLEISRKLQQLTKDQVRELGRVGRGSNETGLAPSGMGDKLRLLQHFPRQESDGQPLPPQENDAQPFARQGSGGSSGGSTGGSTVSDGHC